MTRTRVVIGSVTYAEKGKNVLSAHRIPARIVRLSPAESKNGCAFALEIVGAHDTAMLRSLLQKEYVRFTDILTDTLPML